MNFVKFFFYGDSTYDEIMPIAAGNSKDNFCYQINQNRGSANICAVAGGSGGTTIPEILLRLSATISALSSIIDVVCFPIWSWNGSPVSNADSVAIQSSVLSAQTIAQNAGLAFVPCLITVQGANRQDADNPGYGVQYQFLKSWAQTTWPNTFFNISDAVKDPASPTNLLATYSEDNVHLNNAGGLAAGIAGAPKLTAIKTYFGY